MVGRPQSEQAVLVGLSAGGEERLRIVYGTGANAQLSRSVRLERLDENGHVTAVSGLDVILSAISGVGADTPILTESGERAAGQLEPGEGIVTRSGRIVRIAACETREFGWKVLGVNPFLRPVTIAQGALGDGLPNAALTLSQGAALRHPDAPPTVGAVRGVDLPALGLATTSADARARYVRIVLDEPSEILCAGVWVNQSAAEVTSVQKKAPRKRQRTVFYPEHAEADQTH